jgi:hypothetical protein
MTAEYTLARFAEEQGWNTDSQLSLALQYIDNQRSDDAWGDFLAQQAAEENAYEENDEKEDNNG